MKTGIRSKVITTCLVVFAIATLVGVKLSAISSATSKGARNANAKKGLVVHEWGTFTSIAGKDGLALDWRPLNGPSDLPKFVYNRQQEGLGLRHGQSKLELSAQVRMETPVIYFYSDSEMDVDVKVDFPKGKITEWYPQARSISTSIDWGRLKVMGSGVAANLPVDYSASHYYAARETDAALLQVCNSNGKPAQQEKFLFYRGVGNFELPLSVKLEGEKVVLKNRGQDAIGKLVVFENRGGKIGYQLMSVGTGEMSVARPALDKSLDSLTQGLKQLLIDVGLYDKEATAMVKTWRDSWFEEGLRVFYILPRQTTDAVLPVTIEPHPTELVRVFVGRAEVITPEQEKTVQRQVSMLSDRSPQVRAAARQAIRKYGRFSEPILKRILESEREPAMRERIKELIETTTQTE
jgi:hypothetical protein